MNFRAILALLERARSISTRIERKSICLTGIQLRYSSYEDFAVLLHAFRSRIAGKHLHLTIGVEDQPRKGSSSLPRIFKYFKSTQQMLSGFGFTSITQGKLSKYHIKKKHFEERWRDIADSIKGMGSEQDTFNDYKNKLKHGKPVVESIIGRGDPDCVAFLRWTEKNGKPVLENHWLRASLQELEVATIQVAKIYIVSLELLWLFMLHYYPADPDKYLDETVLRCAEDTITRVRAEGLESRGLTDQI